ncbi:hypothetical protein GGI07_000671 [Coemansia sp. Benny D115]|nr:hypothetical protein GGI07_000671 [Coemansia sp. Benny D115]
MFDHAQHSEINLDALFAQELEGMALAPTPVNVIKPPSNVLVNRVPEGFTPILINLQRCSRSELRKFLHTMLCKSTTGDNDEEAKQKPLGRCGCELLEFEYQPDFLFNKRKYEELNIDRIIDGDSSDDEESDSSSSGGGHTYIGAANSDYGNASDEESAPVSKNKQAQAQEAERNRIKIKRPPNSFMIYRSERHNELVREYRGGNKVISSIIAKEWHSMSVDKRKIYEEKAAIKKREHELLYPNYKFMPKRRKN